MNNYFLYRHVSPSGKVYIGITCKKPEERWGKDGNSYKANKYFYNAIKKYGWEHFKHQILFECLSKEIACQKEIEFIRLHHSNEPKFGYNQSSGGECGASGCKRSDETKRKIGEARKGKTPWIKGKHHSEETKRKLSEVKTGFKHTEEAKKKIGDAAKGNRNTLGKTPSEETRKKLSEANKGKKKPPRSEEHRRKISEAAKNMSDETKRKMSEAHKGRTLSDETRKKMSESRRGKKRGPYKKHLK